MREVSDVLDMFPEVCKRHRERVVGFSTRGADIPRQIREGSRRVELEGRVFPEIQEGVRRVELEGRIFPEIWEGSRRVELEGHVFPEVCNWHQARDVPQQIWEGVRRVELEGRVFPEIQEGVRRVELEGRIFPERSASGIVRGSLGILLEAQDIPRQIREGSTRRVELEGHVFLEVCTEKCCLRWTRDGQLVALRSNITSPKLPNPDIT
ncbi:hypothetical protein BDR06DRAFT_968208 [Suillus hirtellus]|nr:hypothetical protein BDR06DRAFT_968208 [Suillus hirtellus]